MNPVPLDLRDYLAILWRRKWTIAAVTLTAITAALFLSYEKTPTYSSSAEVVVRTPRFDPKQPSAATGFLNMDTEGRVANSLPVAELAGKRLAALNIEPAGVSASVITDAEAIQFTSSSTDPKSAQASAQAYAEAYLEYRRKTVLGDLESSRRLLDEQINDIADGLRKIAGQITSTKDDNRRALLTTQYTALLSQQTDLILNRNDLRSVDNVDVGDLLRAAALPSSPSGPDHHRDGLLGFIVGLGLGVGIAFLLERLDQAVRGRDELELHSGAPVLAFIPHFTQNGTVIVLSEPGSIAAEAFKGLRVRLLHAAATQGLKSIVVTSSLAGEGKTSTAANLGVVLAQSGKQVVLISADLRRPRLQEYFPPTNGNGLRGVLFGSKDLLESLSATGIDNLWVLHAGPPVDSSDHLDVFGSEAMKQLLAKLSKFADIVIMDTAPILAVSDASAMATLADGVLFVTDPRRAHAPELEQARRELDLVGAPVIGVVVNNYDPRRFQSYSSHYRYASSEPGTIQVVPVSSTVSTAMVKRDARTPKSELAEEPEPEGTS